jgi:Flp pilus assembly pilin Flp
MSPLARFARRLVRDDRGGELIEYALVMGLLIIAVIALVGSFGARALARWEVANHPDL